MVTLPRFVAEFRNYAQREILKCNLLGHDLMRADENINHAFNMAYIGAVTVDECMERMLHEVIWAKKTGRYEKGE